jgi:hypothetical protein
VLSADLLERGNIDHRCVPDFHTAQRLGVPVEGPERADIPPQALRDGLKDFRGGIAEPKGLRQDPRHRVLRGQTPFGLRDFADLLFQHGIGAQELGSPFRHATIQLLVGLPERLEDPNGRLLVLALLGRQSQVVLDFPQEFVGLAPRDRAGNRRVEHGSHMEGRSLLLFHSW